MGQLSDIRRVCPCVFFLLLACLGITGCTSTPNTSSETQASGGTETPGFPTEKFEGLEIARIEVLGMSCPLCAHNISQQLEKLPAVKATHIDLGSGIVSVGLDPDAEWPRVEQLEDAVDRAGYTVGQTTVPPRATNAKQSSTIQPTPQLRGEGPAV